MLKSLLPIFFVSMLNACTHLGPQHVETQRNSYSDIIALSEKQELLANIVRAKYNDPPVFLQIKTITVAPSLRMRTGLNVSYDSNEGGLASSIGPSIEYTEEPRIIFSPLSGSEFASELLLPTGLMPMYLMLVNGFRFDKVANLALISINDISNLRSSSKQERNKFRNVIETIQDLINQGIIYVTVTEQSIIEGLSELTVKVKNNNMFHPKVIELVTLLNLDIKSLNEIQIKIGQSADVNHINVHTRSLLSVINYLSNYVEVPEADINQVWPVNFSTELNRPIDIKHSVQEPFNAHVSIKHRGHWFFIDETDIESQNSLYLLRIMFDLQSERDENSNSLLLTLPVQ